MTKPVLVVTVAMEFTVRPACTEVRLPTARLVFQEPTRQTNLAIIEVGARRVKKVHGSMFHKPRLG